MNIQSIIDAKNRIRGEVFVTPLLTSDRLNQKLPFDLYIKAECLQRTGSFKFRGACNAVFSLRDPSQSIIAYSSGNHAQAIALAARITKRRATLIMPEDAPKAKIAGVKAYGAEVILYDRYKISREEIGESLAHERHAELIKPYDDLRVIAGQGTAGLEITEQARERGITPDIYICGCGGGGLMAGSATALADIFPACHLYTAEPEHFDDTARSLLSGRHEHNSPEARSICDAILTPSPGILSFPIISKLAKGGLSVSDTQALGAMQVAWDYFKLTVEPGGAVGLAACLDPKFCAQIIKESDGKRKTVITIASGGNCDREIFAQSLQQSHAF